MASSSASAESVGSSTLSVRVKDVIAIRILDDTGTSSISTLGIDIAPTPNGSTVTENAIVDVATSNETGYTLYMDSDYKEDGTSSTTTPETQSTYTTDLIHTDPTITVTIPSSVPSSSSDTNFWNYTTSWNDTIGTGSNTTTLTGSTPATVIPTHGTPDTIRDDVTEPSDSSMTTIGINVNVNNNIPSGTYKNKLVFTAVANELPPQYTYLQEFDADAALQTIGSSTTLIDQRDSNEYTVTRLADGKAWMTKNMRYAADAYYVSDNQDYGAYYLRANANNVCPTGWRLPTTADYTDLDRAYGGSGAGRRTELNRISIFTGEPLSFTFGGIYRTTTTQYGQQGLDQVGSSAFYMESDTNTTYTNNIMSAGINTDGMVFMDDNLLANTYAVPIRCVANQKTLWDITTMQEMTPNICAATTTPTTSATSTDTNGSRKGNTAYVAQATLSDTRDSNSYTVRKLADGNCWMTNNLGLRLTAGQSLSDTTTDLNSRASWTPTVTTQTTTGTKWGSNGSAGTTGTINDQYAAVEHSYWDNSTLTDGDGISQYKGSYYNWYTATAMSGTWSMGSGSPEDAPDSICPRGWRLPANSGDKSFQNLMVTVYQLLTTPGTGNASARDKLLKKPFSYAYSGFYEFINGNIYLQNNDLYLWGSEAQDTTIAHRLYVSSDTSVMPQNNGRKPYGFSVRCVNR